VLWCVCGEFERVRGGCLDTTRTQNNVKTFFRRRYRQSAARFPVTPAHPTDTTKHPHPPHHLALLPRHRLEAGQDIQLGLTTTTTQAARR
jgi:2-polyprenyl-6-methoxyphenol hydroxylase-like FAD-dependent oxidoreductase